MTRFVAVYEGPTVGSARLLALSAEPRIVSKLFEELMLEASVEGREDRRRVVPVATLPRRQRGDE